MKYQFLLLLLTACNLVKAQAPLFKQWETTFGASGYEFMQGCRQTTDSGYVLFGFTASDSGMGVSEISRGETDFWIVKTNSLGQKQYDKRWGGSESESIVDLNFTRDGGYIIGGYTYSNTGGDVTEQARGDKDFWVVKADSQGVKQWDKRFGGTEEDRLTTIIPTNDGGYIAGGYTESDTGWDVTEQPKGLRDGWVLKLDSAGKIIWTKRIGGAEYESVQAIAESNDGGFVIAGFTNSNTNTDITDTPKGQYDFWLMKVDSAGVKQWDKRYGGSNDEINSSLIRTNDGGYILAGCSCSDSGGDVSQPNRGACDYWLLKVDSAGNKQFDKRFGGTGDERYHVNVRPTSDGGYLLSGNSASNAGADKSEDNLYSAAYSSWIIKTDSYGNRLWDKTLYPTETIVIEFDELPVTAFENFQGKYVVGHTAYSWMINNTPAPPATSFHETDFWFTELRADTTALPSASFTLIPNDSAFCGFPCILFTNKSSFASSYQWYFPGGTPSATTALHANVCYNTIGIFQVVLIATNQNGNDTITFADAITILGGIAPVINVQPQGSPFSLLSVPSGFVFYQWKRNGQNIPNAQDSVFHPVDYGSYQVEVTDTNGCIYLSNAINILLSVSPIEELYFSLSPNPASTQLTISISEEHNGSTLTLSDLTGRVVLKSEITNLKSEINIAEFPNGVYLATLTTPNGQRAVRKVVKK